MAGNLTDTAENKILDHVNGTTAWTPTAPLKLRILETVASTPEATGGTKYTGTTDQTIAFGASSSGSAATSGDCSFTCPGTGDVVGWEILDTAGSPVRIWFGVWSPKTVSAVNTGTDRLTVTGHGLLVGQKVVFIADPTQAGASVPGGITVGTVYFVKTVVDANTLELSATSGGALLDITSSGACTLGVVKSIANPGDTFKVTAGQLTDAID